jgi:hypothetical protein
LESFLYPHPSPRTLLKPVSKRPLKTHLMTSETLLFVTIVTFVTSVTSMTVSQCDKMCRDDTKKLKNAKNYKNMLREVTHLDTL